MDYLTTTALDKLQNLKKNEKFGTKFSNFSLSTGTEMVTFGQAPIKEFNILSFIPVLGKHNFEAKINMVPVLKFTFACATNL